MFKLRIKLLNLMNGLGKKKGSSSPHNIIFRKVSYDWNEAPIDWIPNEPFASHLINTMHLLLPGGELWMCRMLNKALPSITDEKLREDVKRFINQEAMHARTHETAAIKYMRSYNLIPEVYTRRVEWLYDKVLDDKPFGIELSTRLEKKWLIYRIGCMAALEHLTCILGQYALDQRTWDNANANPAMLDLLRWHGAEEVEHRCVVFDVYKYLGGSYLGRFPATASIAVVVTGLWLYGASEIIKQHPAISESPTPLKPWFWTEWSKATNKDLLPGFLWLISQMKGFLHINYNPIDEGSTEQALAYLSTSLGYLQALREDAAH